MPTIQHPATPAVVAKTSIAGAAEDRYLKITQDGNCLWVADPAVATPFDSMREATRMALRLPSAERAFGMPRQVEMSAHSIH